ncbi:MAG: phosphatase PAP2 family protein [Chloroflexota bacterium]|nr:phosphatase PAP2 family protein [Chloroflexota bacterium]
MTQIAEADEQLLLWINDLVGEWPLLDSLMRLMVNDYFIPVSLTLLLLGLWFMGKNRIQRDAHQVAVLTATASVGITSAVVKIINLFYDAERPFEKMPELVETANRIFYLPTDPSFPCNAAAITFTIAAGIWTGNRKLAVVAFIGAGLMSFARVYAAVHYPLDILGGMIIGLICLYFTQRVIMPLIQPLINPMLEIGKKLSLA